MAATISRRLAIDPGGNHHIQPLFDEFGDHRRRAWRIVGGVAVDQHVDVGLDVIEHAPHHVALALIGFTANHGARATGSFDGAVGGIVVVDVDGRFGQRGAEVGDDFGDGMLFVITGHQNRDLIRGFAHSSPLAVHCLTFLLSVATSKNIALKVSAGALAASP